VIAERLRQVSQPAPHVPHLRGVARVHPGQPNPAGRGADDGGENTQQGGLAGAVGAQERVHARADLEVEPVQRGPATEADGEVPDLDPGIHEAGARHGGQG
jgi:hypothetical protein